MSFYCTETFLVTEKEAKLTVACGVMQWIRRGVDTFELF